MQVETFECLEEVVDEQGNIAVESNEEALALVEQLGLTGQKSLNETVKEPGTRFPYREMTRIEAGVYRALCPRVSKLAEYSSSPIPLRVLQVAAHAQGMFDELHVWSAESAAVKDPVLVGTRKSKEQWSGRTQYILARWGEVLEDFEALAQKAVAKLRNEKRQAAQSIERAAAAYLAGIDFMNDETVLTKEKPCQYYLD